MRVSLGLEPSVRARPDGGNNWQLQAGQFDSSSPPSLLGGSNVRLGKMLLRLLIVGRAQPTLRGAKAESEYFK